MTTEYKIKGQADMVKHFQDEFDKLTKKIDDNFPNVNLADMHNLNVIRDILIKEEEKLEKMKNETNTD